MKNYKKHKENFDIKELKAYYLEEIKIAKG